MFKKVKLPDKTIGRFPEEMSWDEIGSILKQQFPAQAEAPQQNQPEMVDTFLGNMPYPKSSQDALQNLGYNQKPLPPQVQQQKLFDMITGGVQGFDNSLIDMANLIPGVNLNKFNVAPNNESSKTGQTIGDVASYFGPRGFFKAAGILNQLKKIENPLAKSLLRTLGAGAETGIFSASKAKENERTTEGLKGAGLGAGVDLLTQALGSKYPILSRLGLTGLGYLGGQAIGGGSKGGAVGAGIANLVPQLKGLMFGLSKERLAENALEGLTEKKMKESLQANEALGTIPTPGQASGSVTTTARESRMRNNAGHLGEELETEQLDSQQKSVNKLLDRIYTPTLENENKINTLYQATEQDFVPRTTFRKLNKNEVFKEAVKKAKQDPSFRESVKGIKADQKTLDDINQFYDGKIARAKNPERIVALNKLRNKELRNANQLNYKYLNTVKTKYDAMIEKEIALGSDKSKIRRLQKEKEKFLNTLDQNNPAYKEARQAAHPKMVREEIEKKLNVDNKDVTGKTFYTKLLGSKKKTEETLRMLDRFPEAKTDVLNIKAGWKQYTNPKTTGTAKAQAESKIDQARNLINYINSFLESGLGKKALTQKIKYIHSKEWQDGFRVMRNAKNSREQTQQLLNMIGRLGQSYGLSDTENENLKSLVTE